MYLENDAVLSKYVHDDSMALQSPDPQGKFQLRLKLVRKSVLDIAVPCETQRQMACTQNNAQCYSISYSVYT